MQPSTIHIVAHLARCYASSVIEFIIARRYAYGSRSRVPSVKVPPFSASTKLDAHQPYIGVDPWLA